MSDCTESHESTPFEDVDEKIIIACDPGSNGGISVGYHFKGKPPLCTAYKIPMSPLALVNLMWNLNQWPADIRRYCYLEKVHSMPGQGVKSTFTFGKNFGRMEVALQMLLDDGDEVRYVTPQHWMKTLDCMTGGDKNVTKRKAQELFPEIKVTHAIADALLIGEYARRDIEEREKDD